MNCKNSEDRAKVMPTSFLLAPPNLMRKGMRELLKLIKGTLCMVAGKWVQWPLSAIQFKKT